MNIKASTKTLNLLLVFSLFTVLLLGVHFALGLVGDPAAYAQTFTLNSPPNNTFIANSTLGMFNVTVTLFSQNSTATVSAIANLSGVNTPVGSVNITNNTAIRFQFNRTFPAGAYMINFTISNTSASSVSETIGRWFFVMDNTTPTFASPVFDIQNWSMPGKQVQYNFTFTETNPSYCGAYMTQADLNQTFINGTITGTTCYLPYLTNASLTVQGLTTFLGWMLDSAGTQANESSASSMVVYNLKTGWNHIQIFRNDTLANIGARMSSNGSLVNQISVFHNGNKTFTSHQIGSSTNANVMINASYNTTFVYSNATTTFMELYSTADGPVAANGLALRFSNSTYGPWNAFGPITQRKTLNHTSYMCSTTATVVTGCNATYQNLVYASYWNATTQSFCTLYKGFSLTSKCGGIDSPHVILPVGQAVFVTSTTNQTFNATGYAGG